VSVNGAKVKLGKGRAGDGWDLSLLSKHGASDPPMATMRFPPASISSHFCRTSGKGPWAYGGNGVWKAVIYACAARTLEAIEFGHPFHSSRNRFIPAMTSIQFSLEISGSPKAPRGSDREDGEKCSPLAWRMLSIRRCGSGARAESSLPAPNTQVKWLFLRPSVPGSWIFFSDQLRP